MTKSYRFLSVVFLVSYAVAAVLIALRTSWGIPAALAAAVLVFFLTYRVAHAEKKSHFALLLFLFSLILNGIWILLLQPEIVSDFKYMYDAAKAAAAGDFSLSEPDYYFHLWAYQTPFVLWESFFLQFWNSPWCLKVLNCFLSAGTVTLMYGVAKKFSSEESARTCSILLAVLPFQMTYSCVLQNQSAAAFFTLLGIFLFLKRGERNVLIYAAAGALVGVGNLLRPEGVLILVAVVVWAVFTVLKEREKWKRVLLALVLFIAAYETVYYLCELLVIVSGVNESIGSNLSEWKFASGLNSVSKGMWNKTDWSAIMDTFRNARPTDETYGLVNSMVTERLHKGFSGWISLFWDKIKVQWNDTPLGWSLSALKNANPVFYKAVSCMDRGMVALMALLSAAGLFPKEKRTADRMLAHFVFFAAFCAFLIVEVQPRYSYMPEIFLFLSAVSGMDTILDKARSVFYNKNSVLHS